MNGSIKLLEDNSLRKTTVRKKVLELFMKSKEALSLSDIEGEFEKLDRITLYRTLKTFENKGIIHRAVDGTNHPKYAMCIADCSEHSHYDNHAHFHCTSCGKTICLESVQVPKIPNLPEGFIVEDTALIISGKCEGC